jgi:hypothetical protein
MSCCPSSVSDRCSRSSVARPSTSSSVSPEVLNRAERLGVIESTEHWLAARKLRNRLVHECAESADGFAADLRLALDSTPMLMETYQRVCDFAATRMTGELT